MGNNRYIGATLESRCALNHSSGQNIKAALPRSHSARNISLFIFSPYLSLLETPISWDILCNCFNESIVWKLDYKGYYSQLGLLAVPHRDVWKCGGYFRRNTYFGSVLTLIDGISSHTGYSSNIMKMLHYEKMFYPKC